MARLNINGKMHDVRCRKRGSHSTFRNAVIANPAS